MNVLIITVSPFPYDTASAKIIRLLSKGLSIHGCHVTILIQRGQTVKTYCNITKRKGIINNVIFRYCCFTKRPKTFLGRGIDILCGCLYPFYYILRNRCKIDLVLTYNNYFYEDLLNVIACKLLNINIISYDVDWYNKSSVVKSLFHLPKWYSYIIKKKHLSKQYSGIIVISHFLKEYYITNKISQHKLLLIPNLLDFKDFIPRSKRVSYKETIKIGFIGGAPILNGVDDLVHAFAILKKLINRRLELIIVGDTTEGISPIPKLKSLASKLRIEESVKFHGRVQGSQIPHFLKDIDIFVLPRKKGIFADAGFPTKLGEYFSTSKPIVLSKVGDPAVYFTDHKEVLFCKPNCPQSLASQLKFLIENPIHASTIGNNGYDWAQKNLDYIPLTMKIKLFFESQ